MDEARDRDVDGNCPSEVVLVVLRGVVNLDGPWLRECGGVLCWSSRTKSEGFTWSITSAQGLLLLLVETALKSSITWLCRLRRSIRRSRIPLALGSRMAGLRNSPLFACDGSLDPAVLGPAGDLNKSVVLTLRGAFPLFLDWLRPSSTQSAGVGGTLPRVVPRTGGGRLAALLECGEFRDDGWSCKPLTLCDLEVGGGPGGGGGSGIPGVQPDPSGGDPLRD